MVGRAPGLGDVDERARIVELLLVAGEERCHVPVGAQAEQDEVEALRQLLLRRAQWMDLLFGNGDAREELLAGEGFVRVRVAGRHCALVAPPDAPRRPVERKLGELRIDGPRSRAGGECDPKRRPPFRALRDPLGAGPSEVVYDEKLRTASSKILSRL